MGLLNFGGINVFGKQQDEVLDEMEMNCLAMNEVLADMIDDLNHTSVYDEHYETRLKAISELTKSIDVLRNRIDETKHRKSARPFDWVGIIRTVGEIAKALIICQASFAQVKMLYGMEQEGVIMSRNLNRIQLPRP